MNSTDYDALSLALAQYANDIQLAKRPGYTRGDHDILKNFKDVAARSGLTPGQAWAVYFLKHIDAITTIMTKPHLPVSEEPKGRFADAINYLYLGFALLEEHHATLGKDPALPPPPPTQSSCRNESLPADVEFRGGPIREGSPGFSESEGRRRPERSGHPFKS